MARRFKLTKKQLQAMDKRIAKLPPVPKSSAEPGTLRQILAQFSNNIAPHLGQYRGGKTEQQIIDLINREVVATLNAIGEPRVNDIEGLPSPAEYEWAVKIIDWYEARISELNQRKSD